MVLQFLSTKQIQKYSTAEFPYPDLLQAHLVQKTGGNKSTGSIKGEPHG